MIYFLQIWGAREERWEDRETRLRARSHIQEEHLGFHSTSVISLQQPTTKIPTDI